jgi:heme oxygenase
MLTEQLKKETAQVHQELDRRLIQRVKSIREPKQYEYLLRLLYGYYYGLEERIASAIDRSRLEDYPLRRKSELIRADLAAFTTEPPYFVPVHVDLPEISDHLQAMGALYALESLTPGGKVMIKLLREQLGLTNRKGLLFFRGYAEETWQKFETLTSAINTLIFSSSDARKLIRSAKETFELFNAWFDKFDQHTVHSRLAGT